MNEVILLKAGELVLKGLNRHTFEDRMIKNARRRLSDLGSFQVWKCQSTIYVTPLEEDVDMAEALRRLQTVFGIAALCRARITEKNWDSICRETLDYLGGELSAARSFRVDAKRSDKSFCMDTPAICSELGGVILDAFPHLRVDLHNPDCRVTVEIREKGAYIHGPQLPGAGGIPVGCGGRAALLLSGGIDSPVAGYRMARRGLEIIAVHFAAPPYTSDRARQKVVSLAQKLVPYTGRIRLFVVPFTKIQEYLRDKGPEEYFTILMRRCMMRIAEQIALREDCGGLITGESVGQVASQTLQALACTDCVTTLPVLRPLIGMDKNEIIETARKIDTFDTSILPYEDCCTVFTPRHPRTRPKPDAVAAVEARAALPQSLLEEAVSGAQLEVISFHGPVPIER